MSEYIILFSNTIKKFHARNRFIIPNHILYHGQNSGENIDFLILTYVVLPLGNSIPYELVPMLINVILTKEIAHRNMIRDHIIYYLLFPTDLK